MLRYIKYAFYKFEKTKIVFKYYRPIDLKLYWPIFNYPKFYTVTYFAQYIGNYNSAINYDTTHSKAAYKYLFKAFYNKTNKKEYNLQIRKHNIHHMNVIIIKNMII